ncbi:LAQU0S01e00804g1_1 [Lachancea quebecensis]|uniref:LAQU0S01e00804g1_1 n=1 Tax=Lachancea quebecensis TaxID=1654605 RepID=A0A0P1KKW5_9SACH|nr:LAQU0S01e00804g1_1 [Lachancea quebecensis]
MLVRRVKKAVSRPFENLGALDRLIQYLRLGSSIMVVVFVMMLTLGALVSPSKIFIGKLNTCLVDIAQGLFDALQQSVEAKTANYVNNGVGLTTSEILILTEYTTSQVHSSPQYVVSSTYGWCRVDNRTSPTSNSTIGNHTQCHNVGSTYIFNYRELMKEIGLNAILEYTYGSLDGSSYESSKPYVEYMDRLETTKIRMVNLLYTVGSLHAVMLVCSLWYYSVKGRSLSILKERILVHLISLISLVVCVCAMVSAVTLVTISIELRSRIQSELHYMGISYHLGKTWFTVLWLLAVFSCISCMVWSGLVWCIAEKSTDSMESYELGILATANQAQDDDDETAFVDQKPQETQTEHLKLPPGTSSSQARLLDDGSGGILHPVVSSTSSYSDTNYQRVVVPLSALSL